MSNVPEHDNLLDEVEDRAANPPVPWDPEKRLDDESAITEQSVAGIVEEIEERDSGYGPFKLTVLRRRDGSRVRVAWFGTVLENRSKNLEIGDAVALTFLGRTKPRDPTLGEYANYDVIHRKPKAGPQPVPDVDDSQFPEDDGGEEATI